jgi:hypothetical protein
MLRYLSDRGRTGPKTRIFLSNVAALPLDETSTFVRSIRRPPLGNMLSEVRAFQQQ